MQKLKFLAIATSFFIGLSSCSVNNTNSSQKAADIGSCKALFNPTVPNLTLLPGDSQKVQLSVVCRPPIFGGDYPVQIDLVENSGQIGVYPNHLKIYPRTGGGRYELTVYTYIIPGFVSVNPGDFIINMYLDGFFSGAISAKVRLPFRKIPIAAGGEHSLAIKTDASPIGWGNNSWDQLNFPIDLSNIISVTVPKQGWRKPSPSGETKV